MDIVKQVQLDAPAEKVYAAFTSAAEISGWWCKDAQLGQSAGEVNKLSFDKEGQIVKMQFRIDALTPHRNIAWTCTANDMPQWIGTTLELNISESNGAATLELKHGGWDTASHGNEVVEQVSGGWTHFLASLGEYCKSGVGMPM